MMKSVPLAALAAMVVSCATPPPAPAVSSQPAGQKSPSPAKPQFKPPSHSPQAPKVAASGSAVGKPPAPDAKPPVPPPPAAKPTDPLAIVPKPVPAPVKPVPPPLTATPLTRPAPSAQPAPPLASAPRSHIIRPGDTLTKLAARYGVTETSIKSANFLKSDILVVGTRLAIPEP